MKWKNIEQKVNNSWTIVVIFLVLVLPILCLYFYYHEAPKTILDNLLNGGLAIVPATWIVIWQVKKENQSKLNEINRHNREHLKLSIFSLLVFTNTFPQLFEPKLRISSLEKSKEENDGYRRIVNLRKDIQAFKEEFDKKSNNLQTQLIYLENSKTNQENVTAIIKCCVDIEFYLQKLINILNEKDLDGGLGYSELNYEEVIIKMHDLKKLICKLPDYFYIDKKTIESHLTSLEYWYQVIDTTKRYVKPVFDQQGKITVSIIQESVDKNVLSNLIKRANENQIRNDAESVRDCLKIFALRNDKEPNKCCYFKDKADHNKLTVELK